MRRFSDPEPVCCAVCKRAAGANGYASKQRNAPIAWVCDNPECRPLLKQVYHMPVRELSQVEAFSLDDAGDEAGRFLQSVGKTDLAELSREEWCRFLKLILTTYEAKMRERLLRVAA